MNEVPAPFAGAFPLEVAGTTLQLLPDRAVAWPARRTLIVADIHFGKDDLFRRAGLAIPEGSVAEDLERLARLIVLTRSERLLVLGDFVHGALQTGDGFPPRFAQWRAAHRQLEIVVVAGNHDRHLRKGGEPMPLDVSWHIGPLHEHGLAFVHDADAHTDADADTDTPPPARYTLAGHVHPVVRLAVPGGTALRVPVFWRRRDTLVLPAFGRLTGGQPVRPAAGDQLLVAGAERVRALPPATS